SMILDVGNSLIGSFDLDGALTRIAHAVRRALGFEIVVVALHDQMKDEFVRRAHAGLDDVWDSVRKSRLPADEIRALFRREFKISDSYYIPAAALRQSERDFFLRTDTSYARAEEWNERDILITPLMRGEAIFGYLSVSSPQDRSIPTPEKVRNLEVFAIQSVQALQSSRQYEEIERLSFTDALTPAFNHRYFQDALAKEIHRHSRSGSEFTLAMLDIDNFKKINDTFGHPVGDEILRGIVDEMMKHARDTDIVARYGGEEFAIIFPQTPAAHARRAANRMRELVERREHLIAQVDRKLRVTVSIGVAIYPRDGLANADLIARADAALYLAKKRGKNQVALASEVSGAGSVAS
ncbi:MAG TPA: sensor domain-containing diguanylate cyclase, partial [Thermoanaerobaculia bacterium]|nr:sensor domain-containing diguanylate cyclase [Thermoanaerobaculia bacterium]